MGRRGTWLLVAVGAVLLVAGAVTLFDSALALLRSGLEPIIELIAVLTG